MQTLTETFITFVDFDKKKYFWGKIMKNKQMRCVNYEKNCKNSHNFYEILLSVETLHNNFFVKFLITFQEFFMKINDFLFLFLCFLKFLKEKIHTRLKLSIFHNQIPEKSSEISQNAVENSQKTLKNIFT